MKHHIIYVPGIGDGRSYGQPLILYLWRLFGVTVHYFPLGWGESESYERKQQRLTKKIKALQKNGGSVSLVGISAGASAVLNAYVNESNVKSVVCICGKINNPQTMDGRVYQNNPDFEESMLRLQKSLQNLRPSKRENVMSIHPVKDSVVPPADTVIPGATEYTINTSGHIFSIFCSIVFKSRLICNFIKSRSA